MTLRKKRNGGGDETPQQMNERIRQDILNNIPPGAAPRRQIQPGAFGAPEPRYIFATPEPAQAFGATPTTQPARTAQAFGAAEIYGGIRTRRRKNRKRKSRK